MRKFSNIFNRLPSVLKSDSDMKIISNYLEKSSVSYSSIFLVADEGKFLIKKAQDFYSIERDWTIYSVMRAAAATLCSTGCTLRTEKDVYKRDLSQELPIVREIYELFKPAKKQNLAIFTKTMKYQAYMPYIDHERYNILNLKPKQLLSAGMDSLVENQQNLPILVEWGQIALKRYFQQVEQGAKNQIDTLLISNFHGKLDEKHKGAKLSIDLSRHYDKKWQSQMQVATDAKGNKLGELNFQIYTLKQNQSGKVV